MRKYQGENIFLSNAIIASSFLFISVAHFLITFFKLKARGQKYNYPWEIKGDSMYGEVVVTDRNLFIWILIGGALEFIGA